MLRILLVQPGATDLDDQGRIKGSLNMPLSENGRRQVEQLVRDCSPLMAAAEVIYTSPCRSARQTAEALAAGQETRVRPVELLRNLDHGLWHGKPIDEVRERQPRTYRYWQEHPEEACPPGGESIAEGRLRVRKVLARLLRRHRQGLIVLVVPQPLTHIVQSLLENIPLADLWKAEYDGGGWQLLDAVPPQMVLSR